MQPLLSHRLGPVRALFLGSDAAFAGPFEEVVRTAAELAGFEPPGAVAALQQIHSAEVVTAQAGQRPKADGLVTHETGLALAVVTADCVPVLLAGDECVAAVHAGWRGLAQGILRTAAAHPLAPPRGFETAWIGPCMAGCCYEVGGDVAARVARASGCDVVHEKASSAQPHLALASAARNQLDALHLEDVRATRLCTGCNAEWWSYRRLGARAGRNLAFIWRTD